MNRLYIHYWNYSVGLSHEWHGEGLALNAVTSLFSAEISTSLFMTTESRRFSSIGHEEVRNILGNGARLVLRGSVHVYSVTYRVSSVSDKLIFC